MLQLWQHPRCLVSCVGVYQNSSNGQGCVRKGLLLIIIFCLELGVKKCLGINLYTHLLKKFSYSGTVMAISAYFCEKTRLLSYRHVVICPTLAKSVC